MRHRERRLGSSTNGLGDESREGEVESLLGEDGVASVEVVKASSMETEHDIDETHTKVANHDVCEFDGNDR